MTSRHPAFFEGTEMPTAGWWETLWSEPARVLEAVGLKRNMDAVDLCCGDGWFTWEMAKVARRVLAIDLDRNMLDAARDCLHHGRHDELRACGRRRLRTPHACGQAS